MPSKLWGPSTSSMWISEPVQLSEAQLAEQLLAEGQELYTEADRRAEVADLGEKDELLAG